MLKLLNAISFNCYIFKRAIKLLPRKNKKIKMFYVEYLNSATTTTQLGLKYKFGNAIWYTIEGVKTNTNTIIIPMQMEQRELLLNVHGFFRKNTYKLHLKQNYIQIHKTMQY